MVGSNRVHLALVDFLQQPFSGCRASQRGSTFGRGPDPNHVLVGQNQIVRTGFGGDVYSSSAGLLNLVDALWTADVDDV